MSAKTWTSGEQLPQKLRDINHIRMLMSKGGFEEIQPVSRIKISERVVRQTDDESLDTHSSDSGSSAATMRCLDISEL